MRKTNGRNQRLAQEREGMQVKTKHGETVTLKKYNNAQDVEIVFSDGATKHCTYNRFAQGTVRHPKFDGAPLQEGEVYKTVSNEQVTIIQYNNHEDVLVQFQNGETKRTSAENIRNGALRSEEYKRTHHPCVGEENINSANLKMRIVEWNSNCNLTVEFEDGAQRTGVTYHAFRSGKIAHPSMMRHYTSKENERIGMTSKAKNGQLMKIIAYRRNADVDVQFEDGTIVKKRSFSMFQSGSIKNPNYNKAPLV